MLYRLPFYLQSSRYYIIPKAYKAVIEEWKESTPSRYYTVPKSISSNNDSKPYLHPVDITLF